MEIMTLAKDSIRIKGKNGSLVVDPFSLRTKTEGDAIVLLTPSGQVEQSKIQGFRVLIKGPGDYEVSGIKITGFQNGNQLAYGMTVDNIRIFLAAANGVEAMKEKMNEHAIVVLYSTSLIDQSFIATLESNVTVLYGENAKSIAASFHKNASEGENTQTIKPVSKYAVTAEKLPKEMEVILLAND